MSISAITFGSPVYSPAFAVSSGDLGVIKLRSRETSPLSHETLDENFTNLANKINEILGLHIDKVTISSTGIISASNLGISSGLGIIYSAGLIQHQARPSASTGYSSSDIGNTGLRFINALDFDSFGHVAGYKTGTITFTTAGHLSASVGGNAVTLSSSAYGSGDSPTFGSQIVKEKTTYKQENGTDVGSVGRSSLFVWGGGTNDLGISSTDSIQFAVNNGVRAMTIDSEGLGIGTTTPSATLEIQGQGDLLKSKVLDLLTAKGSITQGTVTLYVNQNLMSVFTAGDTIKIEEGLYTITSVGTGAIVLSTGYLGATHTTPTADLYTVNDSLCIKSNGNVGIGTTIPVSLLHIKSDDSETSITSANARCITIQDTSLTDDALSLINFTTSNGYGSSQIGSRAVTNVSGWGVRSDIFFTTRNSDNTFTEKLVIKSNGNVGIGTTSPDSALEVIGTDPNDNVSRVVNIRDDRSFAADVGGGISLYGKYNSAGSYSTFAQIISAKTNGTDGDYSGYLAFKTRSASSLPTECMRIDSSGNVGIGTTDPDFLLDLEQKNGGVQLQMGRTNTSAGSAWMGADSTGFHLGVGAYGAENSVADPNGFTVDANGNVGIGTTIPGAKLDILGSFKLNNPGGATLYPSSTDVYKNGTTSSLKHSAIFNTGGWRNATVIESVTGVTSPNFNTEGLYLNSTYGSRPFTSASIQVNCSTGNGDISFLTGDGSAAPTSKVKILNNGNVGIGTTDPGAKLGIAGDVRLGPYLTTDAITHNKMYYIKSAPYKWTGQDSTSSEICSIGMGATSAGSDDGAIDFSTAENVNIGGVMGLRMRINTYGVLIENGSFPAVAQETGITYLTFVDMLTYIDTNSYANGTYRCEWTRTGKQITLNFNWVVMGNAMSVDYPEFIAFSNLPFTPAPQFGNYKYIGVGFANNNHTFQVTVNDFNSMLVIKPTDSGMPGTSFMYMKGSITYLTS